MALQDYLMKARLLMQDEAFTRVNQDDLTKYVNVARKQVAAEGECIRNYCTLPVSNPTMQYSFSLITGFASGVSGALKINQLSYQVTSTGNVMLQARSFPYFNTFYLGQPLPPPVPGTDPANPQNGGPPYVWAQYGQGAGGSIFINLPDNSYTLNADTVCLPVDLVLDTDPEPIPDVWTTAIPFFAAYYAAFTIGNMEASKAYLEQYGFFMRRARDFANPDVLTGDFSQARDPMSANRLGVSGGGR